MDSSKLVKLPVKDVLKLSIEDQIDWYTLNAKKLATAKKVVAEFESVKKTCMGYVNEHIDFSCQSKDEGLKVEGTIGELTATVGVKSTSITINAQEAIKIFGIDTCLPCLSISTKELLGAVGSVSLDPYLVTTTGNRKFQK